MCSFLCCLFALRRRCLFVVISVTLDRRLRARRDSVEPIPHVSLNQAGSVYHQAQLPISAALSGRALGHQLRWAEEFLAKNEDGIDNAVSVLRAHLADIRIAQKFFLMNFKKEPSAASDMCQVLCGYGEEFPTDLKYQVLDLKLGMYIQSCATEKYMDAVLAWTPRGHAGAEAFNPTAPRLTAIEGSPKDRASIFRTRVINLFTTIIRRGQDGADQLGECIDAVLKFIEENEVVDDDSGCDDDEGHDGVDSAIELVMSAAHALQLLVQIGKPTMQASHLCGSKPLVLIINARGMKGFQAASNPYHGLATELHTNTDFYKPMLDQFEKLQPALLAHVPKLAEVMDQLKSEKALCDAGSGTTISKFWVRSLKEVLLPAVTELGEEQCGPFEDAFAKRVEEVLDEVADACRRGHPAPGMPQPGPGPGPGDPAAYDVGKLQASAKLFVRELRKALPRLHGKCDTFMHAISEAQDNNVQRELVESLQRMASEAEAFASASAFDDEFAKRVDNLISEVLEKVDSPGEKLSSSSSDLEHLAKTCIDSADCGGADPELRVHVAEHLVAWVQDSSKKAALANKLLQIRFTINMGTHRGRFLALGASLEARVAAVTKNDSTLKEWIAMHSEAKTKCPIQQENGDFLQIYKDELKTTEEGLVEAKDALIAATMAQLQKAGEECRKGLAEAPWPCDEQVQPIKMTIVISAPMPNACVCQSSQPQLPSCQPQCTFMQMFISPSSTNCQPLHWGEQLVELLPIPVHCYVLLLFVAGRCAALGRLRGEGRGNLVVVQRWRQAVRDGSLL